jgi:hypothetical protein
MCHLLTVLTHQKIFSEKRTKIVYVTLGTFRANTVILSIHPCQFRIRWTVLQFLTADVANDFYRRIKATYFHNGSVFPSPLICRQSATYRYAPHASRQSAIDYALLYLLFIRNWNCILNSLVQWGPARAWLIWSSYRKNFEKIAESAFFLKFFLHDDQNMHFFALINNHFQDLAIIAKWFPGNFGKNWSFGFKNTACLKWWRRQILMKKIPVGSMCQNLKSELTVIEFINWVNSTGSKNDVKSRIWMFCQIPKHSKKHWCFTRAPGGPRVGSHVVFFFLSCHTKPYNMVLSRLRQGY